MHKGRRFASGLSLIEFLVGVTVLAALVPFAVPAMAGLIGSVRLDAANQTMVSSLQLARNSAVVRGRPVVLCKSADGLQCARTRGWEQGWIVFQDSNSNGELDEGEQILHREPPLAQGVRLTGNHTVDSYIAYFPLGQTKLKNGAFQAGTLTVCVDSAEAVTGRQIVISSSGRARTQPLPPGPCV
jgi:type IV fimbrial biogenesis protein FimT